jgi:hypothetical protein
MSKRAAIELSMNFLVIMILAIVILSMGIYFAVTTFAKANEINDRIDRQTEKQIYDLLDTGDPVVAPLNTAEIERGKYHVFWVGVRNIDYTSKFKVIVYGVDDTEEGCNATDPKNIQFIMPFKVVDGANLYQTNPQDIKEHDKATFSVIVKAPASSKPCDYIINAIVWRCADPLGCADPTAEYSTMQKIYATVI